MALNTDGLDLNSYVELEIWYASVPSQTVDSKILVNHCKHVKYFSEILLNAIIFLNPATCQNRNFRNSG